MGLIRVYLYLTLVTSLLLISAGVLKGISYFSFAVSKLTCVISSCLTISPQDELILQCITLAIEGRGWQKSLFVGGIPLKNAYKLTPFFSEVAHGLEAKFRTPNSLLISVRSVNIP